MSHILCYVNILLANKYIEFSDGKYLKRVPTTIHYSTKIFKFAASVSSLSTQFFIFVNTGSFKKCWSHSMVALFWRISKHFPTPAKRWRISTQKQTKNKLFCLPIYHWKNGRPKLKADILSHLENWWHLSSVSALSCYIYKKI